MGIEGAKVHTSANKTRAEKKPGPIVEVIRSMHAAVYYALALSEEAKARSRDRKEKHSRTTEGLIRKSQRDLYSSAPKDVVDEYLAQGVRGRLETGGSTEDYFEQTGDSDSGRDVLITSVKIVEAQRNIDTNVDALIYETARLPIGPGDATLDGFINALQRLENEHQELRRVYAYTGAEGNAESGEVEPQQATLAGLLTLARDMNRENHRELVDAMRAIDAAGGDHGAKLQSIVNAYQAYRHKQNEIRDLLNGTMNLLQRDHQKILNLSRMTDMRRVPTDRTSPYIARRRSSGLDFAKVHEDMQESWAPLNDFIRAANDAVAGYNALLQAKERFAEVRETYAPVRSLRRKARRVRAGRSAEPRPAAPKASARGRKRA